MPPVIRPGTLLYVVTVIPAFSSIARFSSGDIEATRAATLRVIASASSSNVCSFRRLRSYSSRRSCFSMYCSCMELPDDLNAPNPVPWYMSKSRKLLPPFAHAERYAGRIAPLTVAAAPAAIVGNADNLIPRPQSCSHASSAVSRKAE